MRTSSWENLPKAAHPPSSSTISINSLEPPEFPFKRPSSLPHLSYAIENLLISLSTILTAVTDCLLTLYVWMPIGLVHSLLANVINPAIKLATGRPSPLTLVDQQEGKVVIISGASSGIGANLVELYAAPDNVLILLARNPARLNQVAKMARVAGCRAVEIHSIDYSHDEAENSIRQVIQGAHQKYGSIDVLFSVTGTVAFTDDDPRGPEQWGANITSRLTKINVSSTYCFIMTAWDLMKKQRSGKICILASSLGFTGPPQFAAYSATKANLLSFSQSLRALSTPYGIQVSCICPGFIESGMTGDMLAAGSSMPALMLANTRQMAQRIKKAVEEEQAGVIWPISHVLPLVMANKLNWLNGDLFRWISSKIGVTGQMVS